MDLRAMGEALQQARQLGARGVELYYVEDQGCVLEVDAGRVGESRGVRSVALQARVWLDGGRAAERETSPQALPDVWEQLVAAAEQAPADVHAGPVERLVASPTGLSLRDRRHEQLTDEDRAEVLRLAYRSADQTDARVTASGFRYEDRLRVRRFVNSRGVAAEEASTLYRAEGTVSVESPEGPVRITDRVASRSFASTASFPYGTAIARRALGLLQDGESLQAGPVRAVLPARAVAQLFGQMAKHFQSGDTGFFLKATGASVVDARLHLVDDGTLPGGLHTRAFDDRGVGPVPLTLLREGQVDQAFLTVSEARVRDVRPTGHWRDAALQPTNLVLKSGTRSINATLSEIGGPSLRVDDLSDVLHYDATTGAFEARVHGLVMHANQVVGAMRGLRLHGNLLDALNQVVEVCSDTDRLEHVDAPALILEGFAFEPMGAGA